MLRTTVRPGGRVSISGQMETWLTPKRYLLMRQRQLRARATKPEKAIRAMLNSMGIKYQFQKCLIAGGVKYIIDFYLPKPRKVCIEVDGASHYTSMQKSKDESRDHYLVHRRGFRILRIPNELALLMSPVRLNEEIENTRKMKFNYLCKP